MSESTFITWSIVLIANIYFANDKNVVGSMMIILAVTYAVVQALGEVAK